MFEKKYTHSEKEVYYSRLSFGGKFSNSEKTSNARSWLLGSEYAKAVTENGYDVKKIKTDPYYKSLRSNKNLSAGDKAFMRGVNSFIYDEQD